MKIHFIFPLARSNWPLVQLLQKAIPEASFDCGGLSGLRYQNRIQLALKLPRLIWFAFRSGRRIARWDVQPDLVCVSSDMELIGLVIARLISRKRFPIALMGFIYTTRESAIISAIRWRYFRAVLSQALGVICFSKFEQQYYSELFGLERTTFISTLFGGVFNKPDDLEPSNSGYVLSAGRSGRDYKRLCEAVSQLPIQAHIICDSAFALQEVKHPANVTILRQCYGRDYIKQLAGADIVVLPLKNEKTSSGQMVLLDAMALGKPVIITKTATTVEYGEHMNTLYFIEPDSADELRSAINFLMADPSLRSSIGNAARAHYEAHHSIQPFVGGLVGAIEQIVSKHQGAAPGLGSSRSS
ncbi:MAG: glycosyltransferase family 4 protein [Gammaproteobacteria bacterium]